MYDLKSIKLSIKTQCSSLIRPLNAVILTAKKEANKQNKKNWKIKPKCDNHLWIDYALQLAKKTSWQPNLVSSINWFVCLIPRCSSALEWISGSKKFLPSWKLLHLDSDHGLLLHEQRFVFFSLYNCVERSGFKLNEVIFFFFISVVTPPFTLFMGFDKYESK